MKKLTLLIALCLVFVLNGCVTNMGIYDSSVPEEQQCILEIPYQLTVTAFDGSKVSWNVGFWGVNTGLGSKAIIGIPAGEHTLLIDYYMVSVSGNTYIYSSANNLMIKYAFQPGIKYNLSPKVSGRQVSLEVIEIKK